MRSWALLGGAIAVEVAATLSLRASQDHSAWLVVVVAGYLGAFVLLTLVLRAGVPVGVAYGIWGAAGTAGTAVLAAASLRRPVHLADRGRHRTDHRGSPARRVRVAPGRRGRVHTVMWAALAGAIIVEVIATLSLRASDGFRKRLWIIPVVVGYAASFYLLWVSLSLGMPVGIAYGVWTACGVALVAVIARFLFAEPLTPVMGLGIALIVAGVITIELVGAAH